jgi:hypothetical protein
MRRRSFVCRAFGVLVLLSLVALAVPQKCAAHVTSVTSLNYPEQFGGSLIPAPPSVADNVLLDNGDVFEEQNDIVLPVDLHTDSDGYGQGIPGRYITGSDILHPGVIPAGTTVSSIMIHFDHIPVQPFDAVDSAAFWVITDEPIIGVIVSDDLLDDSDAIVGADGTIYPHGLALRGTTVDPTEGDDDILVGFPGDGPNGSYSVVVYSMEVGAVLDEMRIITSPVPEPTSAMLGVVAAATLLGFGAVRSKRTGTTAGRAQSAHQR